MKFVLFLLVSVPLLAQYPGQYPPGQGPMGGGGISLPSWHKKKKDDAAGKQPTFKADGLTVSNNGKTLVIGTADGRTISFALSAKTKYLRTGSTDGIAANLIVPRTSVHIEAVEDDESNLTAVSVQLMKDAASDASGSPASPTTEPGPADPGGMVRPTVVGSPEEPPDHPVLRRGKPTHQETDDDGDIKAAPSVPTAPGSGETSTTDSPTPAATLATTPATTSAKTQPDSSKDGTIDFSITDDSIHPKGPKPGAALVAKTKQWSETFTSGLPNFVCDQNTTRYYEESKSAGWQALDIVTAKVVYEDGKEQYKEITVGGKHVNKKMDELEGTTSTGEFASVLASVFSDHSQADFKFFESTSLRGEPAAIYDFQVALPNSDWTIRVGGQSLRPAYAGSVWIEKNTGQVRRLEMHALKIPEDFPMDSVEWAVDYDSVPLGTVSFLLPVHAENLACQRGATICSKNAVDFRNYHKYSGESTVVFK